MSTSLSFLCFGFFELWNPNHVTLENPKTKQTSDFYTYDSELLGCNNLSRPAQIRSYSPPGSVPYPPNTIAFVFGRAAISKEDGKTLLIEGINAIPVGGDPDAEDYDQNIPEIVPQLIAVGHVIAKAAPIVIHSAVHCAFDTSQVRWTNAPSPFPNTCVQASGTYGYDIPDNGNLGIIIDHITLNLSASTNSAGDGGNGAGGDNNDDDGASPSKKRKFRSSKSRPSTASAATASSSPANPVSMDVCPPTPPDGQVTSMSSAPPSTPHPSRTRAALASFPRPLPTHLPTVPGASPPTPSPSGTVARQQTGHLYPPFPGLPSIGAQVLITTPIIEGEVPTQMGRGRGRRRNTNAADSGLPGPSTPRTSLHPPVAHVTTEPLILPPITSFSLPALMGSQSESQGVNSARVSGASNRTIISTPTSCSGLALLQSASVSVVITLAVL